MNETYRDAPILPEMEGPIALLSITVYQTHPAGVVQLGYGIHRSGTGYRVVLERGDTPARTVLLEHHEDAVEVLNKRVRKWSRLGGEAHWHSAPDGWVTSRDAILERTQEHAGAAGAWPPAAADPRAAKFVTEPGVDADATTDIRWKDSRNGLPGVADLPSILLDESLIGLGWTISDAAQLSGLSRACIGRWKAGSQASDRVHRVLWLLLELGPYAIPTKSPRKMSWREFRAWVRSRGSQAQAARDLGVSQPQVCRWANVDPDQRRPVPPYITREVELIELWERTRQQTGAG